MGEFQERITNTLNGAITSIQAVYVPADDITDPAPATTFMHLDASTVLSRKLVELGLYPAIDPLESNSKALSPDIVGNRHYEVARAIQKVLQKYKELQDIIAILGMDELSEEDKLTVQRAKEHPRPRQVVCPGGPPPDFMRVFAFVCGESEGVHARKRRDRNASCSLQLRFDSRPAVSAAPAGAARRRCCPRTAF